MTINRILAGAVALALSPCAHAQAYGPPANQPDPIEQLHQALHLTMAQQPAWRAYAEAAEAGQRMAQRRQAAAGMFSTLDSPRRMDLAEAEMKAELADMQRQSVALKALYATLSPEQQRIFDAKTLPPANEGGQQGY